MEEEAESRPSQGKDAGFPDGGTGVPREDPSVGIPVAPGHPGPQEPGASPSQEAEVEVDGSRWRVKVAGRVKAGHAGDAGAPLLLLTFHRGAHDPPEREVLVPGADLHRVGEDGLVEAFRRSRPWSAPPEGRGEGGRARGRGDGRGRPPSRPQGR